MKLASKITDLFSDRIWTLDTSGSGRAYAEMVRIIKLIRITFKTFTENRMGFQCVSLSYFITLALVPLMAFAFAVAGIAVYFAALMCTHLAAFRTASNIRKQGMAHLMRTPLGFFDSNASGLLRNRLDGAASETETA